TLYNVKGHPSFDDYARGVLWEHDNVPGSAIPFQPEQLAEMKRRFPPKKLEGLKCFCWLPPGTEIGQRKNGEPVRQLAVDWCEGRDDEGVDVSGEDARRSCEICGGRERRSLAAHA